MRKISEIGRRTAGYIFSKPKGFLQLNLQVLLVAWALYGALLAVGLFSKVPEPRLPNDYRYLQTLAEWQFNKRLENHPRTIDEVVLFEGVNAFVIHLKGTENEPGASHIVVSQDTMRLKPILGQRGVNFRTEKAEIPTDWVSRVNPAGVYGMSTLTIWSMISGMALFFSLMGLANPALVGGTASSASQAKISPASKKTFRDVAGCEEAIDKLQMVVRWLKHPFWYSLWRAKVPKGVLMKGPPGTGKTLLARAVAGEAGLPPENFLTMSGSDFVEMFVGVGAKRVREKFDEAEAAHKKNGYPVILFIDEIDAVGKARSNGPVNNDERDQTLNQLLVCMDGFEARDWLIVLAATNRSDMLDPALLRPGRFDYHVDVSPPDIAGREKILGIHTREMELAGDVHLRWLAEITPGFTGAQLFAVANEAAVIGANRTIGDTEGKSEEELKNLPRIVTRSDFVQSIDFVKFGDYLKSKQENQPVEVKKNTAVHEAGHAGVAHELGLPVSSVSIQMRTKSLGLMQSYSKTDQYGYDEKELLSRIKMAFGGRIAQVVLLKVRDSGAIGDFESAASIARKMVCEMGMSDLGPIFVRTDERGWPLTPIGTDLQNDIDNAWRGIIKSCYDEAMEIVTRCEAKIKRVSDVLLDKETLVAEEFLAAWNGESEKAPA